MSRESNAFNSSPEWTSINTSLAVTGAELESSSIERALGLTQATEIQDGASVHHGPGWWTYTVDERCSGDLSEQVSALVHRVKPHLAELKALTAAGYFIQVAISGTVEPNNRLTLSVQSAGQLADLGLPVSFTTLKEGNVPSEDPLSWLD
ncbi:DUF4279 domain-containing protein [Streptomyces sp. ISL-10]|uniref:DUF4279 domain-containing protein n=1 Tax=Streptomyces sp. ISL-10 TaxID=2819172 RepID=UPI0020355534|nr:DUF4279 domain-containing protein [Streptomyces sp. ISL-10]